MNYYNISFSKYFIGKYTIISNFPSGIDLDEVINDSHNLLIFDFNQSTNLINFFNHIKQCQFIPNLMTKINKLMDNKKYELKYNKYQKLINNLS